MILPGAKLIERFRALRDRGEPAKVLVRPIPRPEAPTPGQVLHAMLHDWAKRAPEEFAAHLAATSEEAHTLAERSRGEHAEMNYWTGYERAIRDVREAFIKWTEPFAGTPAPDAGPALQGGPDGRE